MHGPRPRNSWSGLKALNSGTHHRFLAAGRRYRVTREFVDHDGQLHPVGEEWSFLGYSFLPYDEGMSFFVSLDGDQEWLIPLQWREDEQGPILDALADYISPL